MERNSLFISDKYGWDKVLQLIKTEDYQKAFGKTDSEIDSEWVNYIKIIINEMT